MAAQRAAGEAVAVTLNEQLRPSALRPALPPAANAALVALMQNTSSVAARISIVNLMARSSLKLIATADFLDFTLSPKRVAWGDLRRSGPVLA
jgi:ABC-type arginine/histidine transport system permease subunit